MSGLAIRLLGLGGLAIDPITPVGIGADADPGLSLPSPGTVQSAVAGDTFGGVSLSGWWSQYRADFLDTPAAVTSGYLLLALAVGGAGGSHWYGDGALDRVGYLLHQVVVGNFDIAMELQVFDLAGSGLPPATGDARLAGLAAHDPTRPPGERNYVHRMFGRAPGAEVGGDAIVEEDKSNVDSISNWHTRAHPSPSDCRGWVRIQRRGSTFRSWVSADGLTWINEVQWSRPDLPQRLEVGPAIYSADTDADVSARIYQIVNYREEPQSMANVTAVQTDILEWIFEATQMPTPPAELWLAASTTTPNAAGGNVTQPSGNGYDQVEVTASWGAISSGSGVREVANDTEIAFPQASGSWGTITHVVLLDGEAGNPIRWVALDAPRTVGAGDVLRFVAGELVWTQG